MKASMFDIVNLIYRLANQPAEIAEATLNEYRSKRGYSEAMEAVFQLADAFRKEKAAAGATT